MKTFTSSDGTEYVEVHQDNEGIYVIKPLEVIGLGFFITAVYFVVRALIEAISVYRKLK